MSHRDWLPHIAFGGWLLALLMIGPNFAYLVAEVFPPHDTEREEQKCRRRYQEATAKPDGTDAAGKQKQSPAGKGQEADPNKEAHEYCVQRRAAKASERQADYALWGLALSGVALIGLFGTLVYTARAAEGAHKAAEVAERALVDLERPHLFVTASRSPLKDGPSSDKRDVIFPTGEFDFRLLNAGRSPALLVELEKRFVPVSGSDMRKDWPNPINPMIELGQSFPAGVVVAPDKDNEPFEIRRLNVTESSRLQRNGENLFFLGYVRYRDILGNRYITGFCSVHDREGNRFLPIGDERYNYARKEPSKS